MLIYSNIIFTIFCLVAVSAIPVSPSPSTLNDLQSYIFVDYYHDLWSNLWKYLFPNKKKYVSDLIIYDGITSIYNSNSNQTTTDTIEFDLWIVNQTDISFNGILSNIGGIGIKSEDVSPGCVIASPSKNNPNYFFQWVRDAAITINSLVEYLKDNKDDLNNPISQQLLLAIESYIANSFILQRLDNKSGTWKSLEGLGEPKFMADSTQFNENWGRPQRDGPGLRIITISNFVKFLIDNDLNTSHPDLPNLEYIYNEILKPDLTYIIENWDKNGFDLWEEIDSIHLFTSLTMLKALKSGFEISKLFNDSDFSFKLRLSFISLRFYIMVESGFKNSNIPYLIETPSLLFEGKRSGLDIASILASLKSHDMDDISDFVDIPFAIDDSSVFSTLTALINDMKFRYPINHSQVGFTKGFALGRYPEDLYDGYGISEGNPWFISTATASELLFKLVYYLYYHDQDLIITNDQFPFFASFTDLDLMLNSDRIIFPYGSDAFIETTSALLKYADSFLEVIQLHVDENGNMSEQFNRYSGYMEGAEKLTWSYSSFWSAIRWRKRALNAIDNI